MGLFGITLISDKKLSKLKEKAANVERLQNEMEKAEWSLKKSKQSIKELNEAFLKLEREVDSKDKEILSVGKDLSEKNNEIASLKSNVKKLLASVKKKSEDFTNVNDKLMEATERIEKLEELDKANIKFISDLRYQIEELTKQLENNSIAKYEADEKANAPAEPLDDDEANHSDEVLDAVPDWEMPKEETNPHDLIPEPAPDDPTQEEGHVDENKEEAKGSVIHDAVPEKVEGEGNRDTEEAQSDPNVQKISNKKKNKKKKK